MTNSNANSSGCSGTLAIIGVLATTITSILTCTNLGVDLKNKLFPSTPYSVVEPAPIYPSTNDPVEVQEQPVTYTPKQRSTTISLNYRGDAYNCSLPITITIGNESFIPTGNTYQISNIPLGEQYYQITGQINCLYPNPAACNASGNGTIYITENASFYIMWNPINYGQCNIWLQNY